MERAFYVTSRFFPEEVRGSVAELLRYCGSRMTADMWLGRAFVISAAVFVISSVVFYFTVENFASAVFLLLFALVIYHFATYLILYFKAESRGRAVEKVLPNFLQLIAANINSGMTPFQAFKESSRLEFGVLKEEIDKTIALSLSTMSFNDALIDMTIRVKSPIFKNVIELFVEGMRTGGPLATLLADIAKDTIENLDLKKEIVTRSRSYIIFIAFIVIIGSPLLSTVSIHFIQTIADITGEAMTSIPEIQNVGGITFGQLTLTSEFLRQVTLVNIVATAIIASWLMATISEGKDKYVVKYAIIILPLSLGMFYVLDYVIGLIL